MKKSRIGILLLIMSVFLTNCSSKKNSTVSAPKGEYLYRHHDEELFFIEPMKVKERESYPWEVDTDLIFPRITKYFFRCKGNTLNPLKAIQRGEEVVYFYDCNGMHSLPIKDQKEFVYPVLIDLLNHVQIKSGKKVVVTCGHCCPEHNQYMDASVANQSSKHMIGAEVDFYVQGMENQPEAVIEILQSYYREQPKYAGSSEYTIFKRYEGESRNVSIAPWYNKEIFIKLVKKWEGRDVDNRHPYAYITLQVRFDWDLQKPVNYTWDAAFRNFYRK